MTLEIATYMGAVFMGMAMGVALSSILLRAVLRSVTQAMRDVVAKREYLKAREASALHLISQANRAVIEAQDAVDELKQERAAIRHLIEEHERRGR
jgi:hypothetical protein